MSHESKAYKTVIVIVAIVISFASFAGIFWENPQITGIMLSVPNSGVLTFYLGATGVIISISLFMLWKAALSLTDLVYKTRAQKKSNKKE